MKIADIADSITIDPRKLIRDALDSESPYGKHKAIVFESALGITDQNYDILINQIEAKIRDVEISFHSQDEFGKRYFADLEIEGTHGKRAVVRTGGFIAGDTQIAQLATLYVKKR